MKTLRLAALAGALLAFGAQAQTSGTRIEQRFAALTGSSQNAASLVTGLRTGSAITLTGSGETVTFTAPTRPMGYGNITRSLDLAQRQLLANGIQDPTPTELHTALMGGSLAGPGGTATSYEGVLQLRADGMGWGRIAHTIGVHPGHGKGVVAKAAPGAAPASLAPARAGGGIVTAAGGSPFAHGNGRALGHAKRADSMQQASAGATASAGGGAAAAHGGGLKSGGNGHAFGRSR